MNEQEKAWMCSALELAERGRGWVEPNPLVGAVIVQGDKIVGQGWHERYGSSHAEINALAEAKSGARGATLFVTLEPCCHQGKTGPCTQAIVQAGIQRVVAAMADPYPAVAGQGLEALRRAGLQVEVGLCEEQARCLNSPFLKLVTHGRPYVHAKWAMSLDGKLAAKTGESKWISGPASRQWVHQIRGLMDAIIVGAGTVRRDDPLLTVRPPGPRTPVRIVLAGRAGISLESQLMKTISQAPLLVAANQVVADPVAEALRARGAELVVVPDLDPIGFLAGLLDELGRRRMTNVMVEGGAMVLGSFLDAREIDEVHAFIAPILLGSGRPPFAGQGVETIADALRLEECRVEQIEGDFLLHGRRRK